MSQFRIVAPSQTCTKNYSNYRTYKKWLVKDFSNRCGYCDGSDTWHGGHKSFHIDHFAPKDKFPDLEKTYSNLIYACPSCNSAKSNKWPSAKAEENIKDSKGFLNPIKDDLNEHFERDSYGNILGRTDIAKDMIKNLNLHLERHSIIWMLTKLEDLIKEFETILTQSPPEELRVMTEGFHYEMLKIFFEYSEKLKIVNA